MTLAERETELGPPALALAAVANIPMLFGTQD